LPSGRIVKFDIILAMRIHVLALDGAFDTGLATILDTLVSQMIWQPPRALRQLLSK
jgi:hypothetical protein